MKRLAIIAGIATVAISVTPSRATAQSANSFITYLGLEWAWASPCPSETDGATCGYATGVNLINGWRYATVSEWANRPSADMFLDENGNFHNGGNPMRCASYFFGSGYDHCDFSDGIEGYLMSGPGIGHANGASDTWLVRSTGEPPVSTVPEPATMLLLATGMAGLAGSRRRRG